METKRNIAIDVMKGILIILVVIGHSWWEYRKVIYWFHMPCFFMLSGFLMHLPEREKEKGWILKKISHFLVPYFIFAFVLGLFEIRNGIKGVFTYWIRTLYGGEVAGGVYWFITVLLLSEIIVCIIENRVHNSKVRTAIYISMYLLAIIESIYIIPPNTIHVPKFTKIPWDIDVCLIAVPYIIVGKLIKNNIGRIKQFITSRSGSICIICFIIAICLFFVLTDGFEWFTIDMKYSQYKNVIFDMAVPMAFGGALYMVSKLIYDAGGGIA